ncbi:phage tail protein [Sulfitobacter sp. OXR-159]|uniref:phage tail protein n=1 Tax=Sulfitobacter sp. OXR-159 TaxID=3100174 RepID=UPI002AC9017E|nr:phage tail protein [Sulfitobacter sp. OXR-159]WPZ28969.1 phage tail protein [Sulfitobacter sp. OXR-159]
MLHFDFDASELRRIADEFGASEKQIALAYSRALRRTASNMKTQARKGLRERLGLRSAAELRKRMAGFRFNRGGGDLGSVRMWFGLNDLRASAFKGRPKAAPGGASMAGRSVKDGFVAKNRKGQRTIMRRVGRSRYPIAEAKFDIEDEGSIFIEDEVFDEIDAVFFRNFRAEIRARTIYEVGG